VDAHSGEILGVTLFLWGGVSFVIDI
jgi:hypothetical protein